MEAVAADSSLRESVWVCPDPGDRAGGDWDHPSSVHVFDANAGCGSTPDELVSQVSEHCPGLTPAMASDLLTPDDRPEGRDYGDGVRLASTCRIHPREQGPSGRRGEAMAPDIFLAVQPIEMISRDAWLVICWHEARLFDGTGAGEVSQPLGDDGLRERVKRRWDDGCGRTGADLGTLFLHEFVMEYGDAERSLERWLEDWELGYHVATAADAVDTGRQHALLVLQRAQLAELARLTAVMRNWIGPQNKIGLRDDPARAWLVPVDPELAECVDDRINRVLANLKDFAETLRSSFNMLHVQQLEEQRDRREELMRRIEIGAAAFLIPTLVVGFYGANTWVPGQGSHGGFWVMVVALLAFGCVGVIAVIYMQRQQDRRREETAERETDRLRAAATGSIVSTKESSAKPS